MKQCITDLNEYTLSVIQVYISKNCPPLNFAHALNFVTVNKNSDEYL